MVNCLLLIGVVLYAVMKGGGLGGAGDGEPKSPDRYLRGWWVGFVSKYHSQWAGKTFMFLVSKWIIFWWSSISVLCHPDVVCRCRHYFETMVTPKLLYSLLELGGDREPVGKEMVKFRARGLTWTMRPCIHQSSLSYKAYHLWFIAMMWWRAVAQYRL